MFFRHRCRLVVLPFYLFYLIHISGGRGAHGHTNNQIKDKTQANKKAQEHLFEFSKIYFIVCLKVYGFRVCLKIEFNTGLLVGTIDCSIDPDRSLAPFLKIWFCSGGLVTFRLNAFEQYLQVSNFF